MSDSVEKYYDLVAEGKIVENKLSDVLLNKKEQNIINIIKLCRTVSHHDLDFEIADEAIKILGRTKDMDEVQAIQIAMSKLNIT